MNGRKSGSDSSFGHCGPMPISNRKFESDPNYRAKGKRKVVSDPTHSKLNDAMPRIDVDPETYEVRADGELLACEPATVVPMAQRYFLF